MILFNDLFNIDDPNEYTICFNNDMREDIVSFIDISETADRKAKLLEYISWKKNVNSRNSFRLIGKKCLQFLRIKDEPDRWLFLGAFENKGVKILADGSEVHDLVPCSDFEKYKERLIVCYKRTKGPKQAVISYKKYKTITVSEICSDIYASVCKSFPGYDSVRLSFTELKRIIETPYANWKDSLSVINGIYVILDTNTGRQYVGSTYGCDGVWGRWSSYVATNGHGNDIELKPLIIADPDYAVKYFQFSLVEYFFNVKKGKHDESTIRRENFWKEALGTRRFGYNHN